MTANRKSPILALLLLVCSCAPVPKLFEVGASKTGVNYKSSRGTIFDREYEVAGLSADGQTIATRWTPNREDIQLAEKLLRKNLKRLNSEKINQSGSCPVIHRNLYSYFRQYVGLINSQGERIIHINFYWNKYRLVDRIRGNTDSRLAYGSDYSTVFDGCSFFWQINVNLDREELGDLHINGVA